MSKYKITKEVSEDLDTDAAWFEKIGKSVKPPKTKGLRKISTEEILDYDEELISFFNRGENHDKSGAIKAIKTFATKRNWDISKVDLEEVISQIFSLTEDGSTSCTTSADIASYPQRMLMSKKKKINLEKNRQENLTRESFEPVEIMNGIPVFEVTLLELLACSKSKKQKRNKYYLKTESILAYLKETAYRKPVMIRAQGYYLRLK